ncbi:hypothetical protein E6C70_09705 [Glaciibacter flavus]|uniref:Uncharacterized protein n=1 Tax=Orlajensenia flava TaxID=2565934 RepID=A0A4S4FUI6_9MICO|nr:hypothetical protein E6C70_09705 [Glaciibacter flavus]
MLFAAAVVLAGVGVVLLVWPSPSSFGWFAVEPDTSFGFVGGVQLVGPMTVWGWALIGVSAIVIAGVSGWLLGRRYQRRQSINFGFVGGARP